MSNRKSKKPRARDPEEYFRTDHLSADLRGRSVQGGVITMIGQISKFVLQLGSTAVLARLLTPEDYGLIGMVTVVVGFISLFKDLGLSTATIQREEITHNQVTNLFWVNVGVSGLIMLLTILVSPGIAWFYGEPRLIGITIVLASGFVFSGLSVQHLALLRRQMSFTTIAKIEIGAMIVSISVAVIWCFYSRNYWALVLQQIVFTIASMVGTWLTCGWRPGMPKRFSGTGAMLAFGGHLTGFNILNYFSRNLDNVLIGWKVGPEILGVYAKAYQLLLMPFDQINAPIAKVALPTLSRLQRDPDRYRVYYTKAIRLLVTLGMPLVVFMFVAADKLILTVLGDQWQQAILIFRLLAPAAFVSTFNVAAGWVYVSLGRSDRQLRWGLLTSFVDVIAFTIGVQWGAIGVATAYSISRVILRYPAILYCYKGSFLKINDLILAIWRPTVASLTAGIALYASNKVWQYSPNITLSLLIDTISYVIFYIGSWVVLPNGWQTLIEMISVLEVLRPKSKEASDGNSKN